MRPNERLRENVMTDFYVKFGMSTIGECSKRAGIIKFDPSSYGECVRYTAKPVRTAEVCENVGGKEICESLGRDDAAALYAEYEGLMSRGGSSISGRPYVRLTELPAVCIWASNPLFYLVKSSDGAKSKLCLVVFSFQSSITCNNAGK